jgi:hypothetical protein
MAALRALLRALWRYVRDWSGDSAYETYLRAPGARPLSRGRFWLESVERRYERPSRCC